MLTPTCAPRMVGDRRPAPVEGVGYLDKRLSRTSPRADRGALGGCDRRSTQPRALLAGDGRPHLRGIVRASVAVACVLRDGRPSSFEVIGECRDRFAGASTAADFCALLGGDGPTSRWVGAGDGDAHHHGVVRTPIGARGARRSLRSARGRRRSLQASHPSVDVGVSRRTRWSRRGSPRSRS